MFKLFGNAIGVLAVVFAATSFTQASVLDDVEIRKLVNGKRVFLKIPLGGEFPLKYQASGVVRGDGSGVGLGKFLAPKDTGRWWIADGRLCQKWKEWYKGKTTCFVISDKNGKNFRWKRSDGRKGKARVE